MAKATVDAESNLGNKKIRKQRQPKVKILNPQEILEMSKQMSLADVANAVRLLKADVERRSTEIKEILKTTEGL